MAAEHAILGLLALSESGMGHGYDLARQFSPEAPLGNVVRLEPGMVYHHLKKLERLGWVSAVPEIGTGEAGAAALCIVFVRAGRAAAMARRASRSYAGDSTRFPRQALSRTPARSHAGGASRGRATGAVRSSGRISRQPAAEGATSRRSRTADSADFGDMVLDMRLAQTRAALAWLDRVGRDAAIAVERANA